MGLSFKVYDLKKISSKLFRGKFVFIVPKGFGTPLGSFLRNILLSEFPTFGLQALTLNTFEYNREHTFQTTIQELIEGLKKVIFTPSFFALTHHKIYESKTYLDWFYVCTGSFVNKKIKHVSKSYKNPLQSERFKKINWTNQQKYLNFQNSLFNKGHISQVVPERDIITDARMTLSFESYQNLFCNTKLMHRGQLYEQHSSLNKERNSFGARKLNMQDICVEQLTRPTQYSVIPNEGYFFPKQVFQTCLVDTTHDLFNEAQGFAKSPTNALNLFNQQKQENSHKKTQLHFEKSSRLLCIPRNARSQMTRFFTEKKKDLSSQRFRTIDLDELKEFAELKKNAQDPILSDEPSEKEVQNPFLIGFCQISNKKPLFARDIQLPKSISIGNPDQCLLKQNSKRFVWNVWFKLGFEPILSWNHPCSQIIHLHKWHQMNSFQNNVQTKVEKFPYQLFPGPVRNIQQKKINIQSMWKQYPNCFFLVQNFDGNGSIFSSQTFIQPQHVKKKDRNQHSSFSSKLKAQTSSQKLNREVTKILPSRKLRLSKPSLSSGKLLPLYEIDCRPPMSVFQKVHFSVENIDLKYEKLFIELYTNGSLSPFFAFECAKQKVLGILRFCQVKENI